MPAESIPQPQHDLLVHFSDMTSTLTRHYGEPMRLKVLHRQQGPQWYRRHIVLETAQSRRPVEYGAMRILLPLLSEAARLEVLAARTPLGADPGPAWTGLSPLSGRVFQDPLEPPDRTIAGACLRRNGFTAAATA